MSKSKITVTFGEGIFDNIIVLGKLYINFLSMKYFLQMYQILKSPQAYLATWAVPSYPLSNAQCMNKMMVQLLQFVQQVCEIITSRFNINIVIIKL